jgi:hypothetical protein
VCAPNDPLSKRCVHGSPRQLPCKPCYSQRTELGNPVRRRYWSSPPRWAGNFLQF